MTLLEEEEKYCRYLRKQTSSLVASYDGSLPYVRSAFKKHDITKAILLRMHAYYTTQNYVKLVLNKRNLPAASDFFVETLVYYIKLVLEAHKSPLEVHSERPISQKRGSIRPDISVWKGDALMCTIECKTQLGWQREGWNAQFIKREKIIRSMYPRAKGYLVVMTSQNWPGFPEGDKRVGKQLFTLSSVWPSDIDKKAIDEIVLNPIEPMLKDLINK